ncbi:MAG TPA: TonB-dependent receptor [Bacteroidetes bacterium]|nr:TonB-dependent receptor [Bacteroidota bacterium]
MNKQNNNWFFGKNQGLNFNPGPTLQTGSLDTFEGCAAISDRNTGALLFYTDGIQVWNQNGAQMPNGFGLLGNPSSTSSAIIVPRPGSSSEYYIFTVEARGLPNGFRYSTVDMNLNAGLGNVVTKNVLLVQPTSEKVAAVPKFANCEDYWIISTGNNSNAFYVYSLDASSITALPVQNTGPAINDIGYLKVSPLGDKIALANFFSNTVEVYDFNNATGAVSHSQTLTNIFHAYGIEFSGDGNLLYFSSCALGNGSGTGIIYQKELNNSNPPLQLASIPNNGFRYASGALQMGPDGIIYAANDQTLTLDAILNPNVIGAGCNFTSAHIALPDFVYLGLPTLVQFGNCDSDPCAETKKKVNEILEERCKEKKHALEHCNEGDKCECDPNTACASLEIPEIKPCISIKWGDSECDCLEGTDCEVLCITVCNCYSNVTFKDFTIGALEVCDENGDPVSILPDGKPSVQLVPVGPYCFGDVEPCSCTSREFSLLTCGAKGGKYKIKVEAICFDVCFHYDDDDCFVFEICAD